MTHEETRGNELPFPSDFTARVLEEADAIATRRRKTRSTLATISVAVVAGAVAVSTWQMWPTSAPDAQRLPHEIASSGNVEVTDFQGAQPTLLDFMFPDAAALSQFSDQYKDGVGIDVMENDAVFFPDVEDEAVIDDS
jgi:hypothetical protein